MVYQHAAKERDRLIADRLAAMAEEELIEPPAGADQARSRHAVHPPALPSLPPAP
jgi:hypothetical protein